MKKKILIAMTLALLLTGCGESTEPAADVESNAGAAAVTQAQRETEPVVTEEVWMVTLARSYNKEDVVDHKVIYTYDEQGRLSEEKRFGNEEETIYYPSYKYTYGEDGSYTKKSGSEIYEFDANGNETYYKSSSVIRISTYDENGNMLSRGFGEDGTDSLVEYTYDDQGNLIEEQNYEDDGTPGRRDHFEYDANGNLTLQEVTKGDYIGATAYTYNDHNDVTSETRYDNGKVIDQFYFEYTYDEAGNLLTHDAYYAGGQEYHEKYTYNDQGLMTSFVAGDEMSETCSDNNRYEYDENGNLVYILYLNDSGTLNHERHYEYDENGNMTLDRITYENYEGGVKHSDVTIRYVYDANGNLIMEENYMDGKLNYRDTWEYELITVVK